jgi:hypothetical protein
MGGCKEVAFWNYTIYNNLLGSFVVFFEGRLCWIGFAIDLIRKSANRQWHRRSGIA